MIASENELRTMMIASQDGDAPAYRHLLTALRPRLEIFYRRRVHDGSAAEDLVQEALMAIHIKRDTFDPGQPFTPWVYGIARYKLLDYYRRHHKHQSVPLDGIAEFIGEADHGFAAADARMDLGRLMQDLPAAQSRAVQLTKLEELSVAEAAEKTQSGTSAVKVNVHRGLKALIAKFQKSEAENV
ncbi:sigma-70 family RNA polymerase sigma factor [uncultured Maricaulis sp.]|uniref:sigma-70 family RNA polymerase sigma factor n=1 Tax=uncultured Maricaulis sp. TaxID=174710 RepID=UPI0030D872CD|tara:strand:+ start:19777 stop:20331 length:555 start_codon:yes stop_codon:yes gene_type:complete